MRSISTFVSDVAYFFDEMIPGPRLLSILLGTILSLGLVLLLGYHFLFSPIDRAVTVREETITITDRERINKRNSSRYVIFAREGEFEVTDTLFFRDFAASSRYNRLEPGLTCKVTLSGRRIPVFSRYPNIVKILDCSPPSASEEAVLEAAETLLELLPPGTITTPEALLKEISRINTPLRTGRSDP